MVRLAIALGALAVAWTVQGQAQSAIGAPRQNWTIPDDASIRLLLEARLTDRSVGTVIGVIEPSGTRLVAHGRSDGPEERPLDGESVFQIGSLTKVFTGLLLADMVVRGEVQLDDPVSRFLPPGARMPQRGRAITLLDLSKHWSGLPTMPANFDLDGLPDPYAAYTERQLYEFLAGYALPREPGRQEYSNLGVALLGRVLARRVGVEYETLLRDRVVDPLSLQSTAVTVSPDMRRRLSPGHDRYRDPVATWELVAMPASGSLRSTANDLLRLISSMCDPASPLREAMQLQLVPGRSLGWGRSTLGGEAVFGHEGGKEGYRSAMVFNPRTRTGVVVLMNTRSDESPMELARYLLYGESALPPQEAVPQRPPMVRLETLELDQYVGRYRLASGEVIEIASRGGELLVHEPGGGIATYFASAPDVFWAHSANGSLRFDRGPTGEVYHLRLQTDDTQRVATRLR